MKHIPAGEFWMGSEDFYPDERPVRVATVESFWMDETPVTNAEFAHFVDATGYISFAEIAPDPRDYPGMPPEMAVPGSIVFTPVSAPVNMWQRPAWWRFVFGAYWRHPLGPGSSIDGIENHPVVHVAYADAEAYARWAGKSLPTEAEWEYAARSGLDRAAYAWGEEFAPDGQPMAKTWQGEFPWQNLAPDGLERTSPVRSYPANRYGLYDLIGNVWEWTADRYETIDDRSTSPPKCCGGSTPPTAGAEMPPNVTKGGSHLCAPNYCRRYRPAARWPQPIDTSTSHLGFRCVVRD